MKSNRDLNSLRDPLLIFPNFKIKISLLFCLILLFSFNNFTHAQNPSALEGRVLNSGSQPVEDALVRIINSRHVSRTDSLGYFRFESIAPGTYLLHVETNKFSSQSIKIDLTTGYEFLEILLESGFESLPEVTVTAQKREEFLQDVPLSITSLSYREIKDSRIQNVNDLAAIAPNLYAGDPGDRRSVTSIRGIVSASYDPAVATYIDGVNQFNLDTYIPQLLDIKRIEVLRGPQGTLYGRNAMGGVINIHTREPGPDLSVFGEATFANYNKKRFLAGIKTPLLEDKLFFGAAALYEAGDGFFINEFDNSNYDEHYNFSGNYYLKYVFDEHWKANLNFKHFSNRDQGAFPLVMGIEEAMENPFRLNQNQTSVMVDNTLNASFVLDYKGNHMNFSSQTSFQKNYRFYKEAIDADFSPLDALSIYNNYGRDWNNVKVVTQEIKFSSAGSGSRALQWTVGSFLFYQESPVRQAIQFGGDAGLLGIEDTHFSLISTSETISKGAAVFGQLEYAVTSRLDLIAGLRYDYEEKQQSVLGEYQRFEDPQPVFEFQKDTTAQANFKAVSPKTGFSFSFSEEQLIFATYSNGFRAGGLTPFTSDPSQPPLFEYQPEFSSNFEVGSKNEFFSGRFLVNATLFYTQVTDVQVPTLVLPEAVTITKNTGKLSSKGFELELKGLLFPGLHFSYDLGYTDAEYQSLRLSGDEGEQDLTGNKQIFTPEITSMLALQYGKSFGKDNRYRGSVRGEWKHLGKQYFDLQNTLVQEPYDLFNGQVGLSYREWEITVWGRNLLDQRYVSYGYNFGAVRPGNPATMGITLSLEF